MNDLLFQNRKDKRMSELQIVRFRGDVQSGCYIIFVGMKYDLCWRLESELLAHSAVELKEKSQNSLNYYSP